MHRIMVLVCFLRIQVAGLSASTVFGRGNVHLRTLLGTRGFITLKFSLKYLFSVLAYKLN
jgi:hypothetical protein